MAITRIGLGGPARAIRPIAAKSETSYTSRTQWGIMGSLCRWIIAYG